MDSNEIDKLKIGTWYHVFVNGESLGEMKWSDDKHNGLCFLKPMVNESGEYANRVLWVDQPGVEVIEI